MSDIVIELQKELIDKSKKLSDILPKAYLIARNLSLNELANWLKLEMNGYNDKNMKKLPKYRIIKGDIKAHNPYRGWVPVAFVNSQELENLATNSKCSQSISELENILEKCKNDHDIYISVPGLSKYMNPPMPCAIFCGSSPIIGRINNVRNQLLEWTIKLKEKGIAKELIEMYFEQNTYEDKDKIIKLLEKKGFDNDLSIDEQNKIKVYLLRKGFNRSEIENAIKCLESE